MKLFAVESDNFNCLMTERAYKELRLQMSTGDFHMHHALPVAWAGQEDWSGVVDLDDESGEFFEY